MVKSESKYKEERLCFSGFDIAVPHPIFGKYTK